jgi:hypothetical protein
MLGLQLHIPGLGNVFVLISQNGKNWTRRSLVVGVVKRGESSGAGRRKSAISRAGDGFESTLYHFRHTPFAERTSVEGGR